MSQKSARQSVRSLPLAGPTYPSASALSGAAICVAPWSLGLPREDTTSPDAERGTDLHLAAKALALGETRYKHFGASDERALEHVLCTLDDDLEASGADDQGPRRVWLVEQGVRWRSRDLGDEAELVQREPGQEERGWFPGTADLVYLRQDGVLIVADWKFGPRQRWTAERAENHWQGWSLALFFATALTISAARGDDVVARFEARYVDEEGAHVDGVDITQAELDQHAVVLTEMARRIEESEGPRVGAACGSCKAHGACPAYAAIGQRAAEALVPSAISDLWAPPRTEEAAALLHYRIGAVETWLERAKEHRRAYVLTHPPVPLGLGQELAAVGRKEREVVRTPEALAVIEEIAGPAAIEAVTKKKTGIGLIEKAARARIDPEAFAYINSASDRRKAVAAAKDAAEQEVLDELARRGVLQTVGTTYAIGVRRSSGDVEIVDRLPQGGEED